MSANTTTYTIAIDWDNDGSFETAGDDITAYVDDCDTGIGFNSERDHVATAGQCVLVVKNEDRRFSPLYTAGPLYGKLTAGLPVRVQAHYGATTKTIFYGYTLSIIPDPGAQSVRQCVIRCEDTFARMNRVFVGLPLVENQSADKLLTLIFNEAFGGDYATGTITVNSVPEDGDQVCVGDISYTFRDTLGQANDLRIGDDADECAQIIADAIRVSGTAGTDYHSDTVRNPVATATVTGSVVTVTSIFSGTQGNSIILRAQTEEVKASALIENTGEIKAGSLSDTYHRDGNVLQLSEVGGTPGFDYEFTFALGAGDTPQSLKGYIRYQGSVLHQVNVDVQPEPPLGTWFKIGDLPSTSVYVDYVWTGANMGADALGNVRFRFYHETAGNASHNLYIDHLYVVPDEPSPIDSITVSDDTLTGGTNEPDGKTSLEVGERNFEIAADFWDEERTTGAQAARDVARSEYGYLWAARDGTLTFKNRYWLFTLPGETPALTLDNNHDMHQGMLTVDRVRNRIYVTFTPRRELATGVIAQSANVIRVPGNTGTDRWSRKQGYIGNSDADAPQPGDKLVRLPFVDPDSGRYMGAKDIITPVAGTDYSVNDAADGSGFDYTNSNRIFVSLATTGNGVEASFRNTATGPLYVTGFQVRGTGIVSFDPQESIREDSTSIADHGRRDLRYTIPLESGEVFADAIANYELARYKTPRYIVERITFDSSDNAAGVQLMALDIGDVIKLSEGQTGTTDLLYVVWGIAYKISGGNIVHTSFEVREISDTTYWILGDETYGVLGSTTRLAL